MSNLLASLSTAGNALVTYQKVLDVVQNNISNASTPGFARQNVNLTALPFDLASGLLGGVAARGLDSARDEYVEQSVRQQAQTLGRYETQASATSSLESLFDISGTTGVPAQLSQLFQAFSSWSVTPNSASARQSVISSATTFSAGIRRLQSSLATSARNVRSQIGSTVDQINQLTAQIGQYNVQRLKEQAPDPGLDASMHSALEQLSELTDSAEVTQPDGTVTVLLSGGSPLVIGETQYAISSTTGLPDGSSNSLAPPSATILDSLGNDITGQIQNGKLGGLLDVHNRVLASIIGDGTQAGSLNRFAQSFADTVNKVLESGTTTSGGAAGIGLFTYDSSDPTLSAATLTVKPDLTPDGLAAVDSAGTANGNALALAGLADSSNAVDGVSFTDFFSGIATAVGTESANAQQNRQTQQSIVSQARSLRDQTSGVSLDQQAVLLLSFQRSYQAAARLLTTLNDVADTTINLIK